MSARELAQSVWYLRQDLSEKARAQGYLSCLSDMRGGGFPEETARLAERLRDPAFREVLMDDFAQLRSDYREDRSLLRFHYHKPDKIELGLRELSLPLQGVPHRNGGDPRRAAVHYGGRDRRDPDPRQQY